MEQIKNDSPHFYVLVKEAANGNRKSFQLIYDALAGKMYSLCLRYAGNVTDANDWFQDAFVKLVHNLNGFKGAGSFEGWARKIFISTCLDHLKKATITITPIELHTEINDNTADIYNKMNNEDIMNMIRQLPDWARTIINLNLIEGYSHKEIGELLDLTEEGSRSQLFRARTLLKKIISVQNAAGD